MPVATQWIAPKRQRIEIETQCWLLTAFGELDRLTELPSEQHQKLQSAIKARQPERIACAFESLGESLDEMRSLLNPLAEAVRTGHLPALRRLVFEIARRDFS